MQMSLQFDEIFPKKFQNSNFAKFQIFREKKYSQNLFGNIVKAFLSSNIQIYLQIPLLPTSINPENLGHFVSDIKSNLRKEFSALMAMADVEEALVENAQQLANHPSMFASRKRFYL